MVKGGNGTCVAGMGKNNTRSCIGHYCGVDHHRDGHAKDCTQITTDLASEYIKCDDGFEAWADFDNQTTKDGKGACLFTCIPAPPQCAVSGAHGTCTAGMTSNKTRFCIGGDHYCGVYHHSNGPSEDCTESVKDFAGKYIKCDKGYVPSAAFDNQTTKDGNGACLFTCERAQCNVMGKHGTCTAGLTSNATDAKRFCIGGDQYCGVFHHSDGPAENCTQIVDDFAGKYVDCDAGYEPSASFNNQTTKDGKGACLFTCAPVPSHSKSGLSTGAIVGIAVGGTATVAVVLVAAIFLYRRGQSPGQHEDRLLG